jgi:hypothetical protein
MMPTSIPRTKATEAVEQPAPQLIPEGLVLTVPVPVPVVDFDKVSWNVSTKVAVTFFSSSIITLQVPVALEHTPDHPVNLEPGAEPVAAAAVKVTGVLKSL